MGLDTNFVRHSPHRARQCPHATRRLQRGQEARSLDQEGQAVPDRGRVRAIHQRVFIRFDRVPLRRSEFAKRVKETHQEDARAHRELCRHLFLSRKLESSWYTNKNLPNYSIHFSIMKYFSTVISYFVTFWRGQRINYAVDRQPRRDLLQVVCGAGVRIGLQVQGCRLSRISQEQGDARDLRHERMRNNCQACQCKTAIA